MKLVLGAAACVAILITAGGGQTAQRFAAPEGKGGEPCAQAAPCSLKDAIAGQPAGWVSARALADRTFPLS